MATFPMEHSAHTCSAQHPVRTAPDADPDAAATDIDARRDAAHQLMPNAQMPDWLRRDLPPVPAAPSHTNLTRDTNVGTVTPLSRE